MPLHTPLRIGVLGAGWFASRRHCPDIVAHHNAELTALCRRNRQQLQQMDDADFDLRCALTLRLDNGAYATLNQCADSRTRAKRQHSIYYGSAGTVAIHGFPFNVKMESGTVVEEFREDELKDPPTPVGDLIRCALGEGKPQIDGETAVHVVEIIQSAAQAAREGRAVRIRTAVTTQGTIRATP
jgi:predicted dehydrogenase